MVPVTADTEMTTVQNMDASTSSQAALPQAAVHVPRPTAKEAWNSVHQTGPALDMKEGVLQGTSQKVNVLVSC